jgi:hypothetical protein
MAHAPEPWRSDDPLDAPVPRSVGRQLGGLEVPLAEELEAYEAEILDGATVKRVLSTATTSAVNTSARQTADWGAPLGLGDSLAVRNFQLFALVGRGLPKTVTLGFLGRAMSSARPRALRRRLGTCAPKTKTGLPPSLPE